MSHTKEWEALNRILKILTKEQRAELYDDFKLVHSAIQNPSDKIETAISEEDISLNENQKQEAVKIETTKQTNDISDVLILRKSGNYFEVRGRSAHVLHQISGLKMSKQGKENRSWFKKEKLDHYVSVIEKYSISYIIREPNNLILKRKDFGNNRFREFLEPRTLSKIKETLEKSRVFCYVKIVAIKNLFCCDIHEIIIFLCETRTWERQSNQNIEMRKVVFFLSNMV